MARMKSVKAILFDLDGTLLNTIGDIARSANETLSSFGYPIHPEPLYLELVGDGLDNLARKILPEGKKTDEDVTSFTTHYREVYTRGWNKTSHPYPGVTELLQELVKGDIPLAILSNKRHDFTKLCVQTFFPEVFFAEIRGEQSGVPIKPHPEAALLIAARLQVAPSECLFVGDSEIDIETAKAAGMVNVGVEWGFRPRSILEDARADYIISHPHELLAVLQK